jgi:tight adherence protein C
VTLLIPLLGFLFVTLVIAAGALAFSPRTAESIERRLGEVAADGGVAVPVDPGYEQIVVEGLKKLGRFVPRSPSEMGKLQQRLVCAGYRRNEAVTIFVGIRVGFALVCFVLLSSGLIVRPNLMIALVGCGIGYVVPAMVLARMAKRRAHRIQLSLADALDLLVVSVEAGLGLDQAIMRVGDELAFAHPDLSDELRLVNLELRAGKGRPEALRNLADRTGVEDLTSLTAMLIQTDKFGTSIAQALRVHSETLRTKRRQRAEEAAAKIGAKMVFPLVCCIFPAIWVVTIGPAAIKFIQVLVPLTRK